MADAGVFVGFGFGLPIGFPFFYPPYPYPPPPYNLAPVSYPPVSYPTAPAPSYPPATAYAPAAPSAAPSITYTPRAGWMNAQGEYCREYKTTQGTGSRATQRFGSACRDQSGPWRIVN